MAVAMGGRVAEELIFGEDDITTGAAGDFQQVSRIARAMVTQMGFSKELGQVAWKTSSGPSFLGQEAGQPGEYSSKTADAIDEEVKTLVERAYRRAKDLLQSNMDVLHGVADVLMEKETIDGDEFMQLVLSSQAVQYLKEDAPELSIPYQRA